MKKQKEQVSKQNRVEKENSMPREVQQRENKRRNKIKRSRTLEKRGEKRWIYRGNEIYFEIETCCSLYSRAGNFNTILRQVILSFMERNKSTVIFACMSARKRVSVNVVIRDAWCESI